MKKNFSYSFLFLLTFFTACMGYDKAFIYHANFHPGTNPHLRFDGYYSDSATAPLSLSAEKTVKPVFLYANGSAFSAEQNIAASSLQTFVKKPKGSWGNYEVNADTVTLEKFEENQNEADYQRVILQGVISANAIHWTKRKFRNESYKPVDYTIYFTPFTSKPDSTLNFTRTKKKYNQ